MANRYLEKIAMNREQHSAAIAAGTGLGMGVGSGLLSGKLLKGSLIGAGLGSVGALAAYQATKHDTLSKLQKSYQEERSSGRISDRKAVVHSYSGVPGSYSYHPIDGMKYHEPIPISGDVPSTHLDVVSLMHKNYLAAFPGGHNPDKEYIVFRHPELHGTFAYHPDANVHEEFDYRALSDPTGDFT